MTTKTIWLLAVTTLSVHLAVAAAAAQAGSQVSIDADGTTHLPAFTVPYSELASPEARKNLLDFEAAFAKLNTAAKHCTDVNCTRKVLDDLIMRPGVARLRATFAVTVTPEVIGGIQTDVIVPAGGIAAKNKNRVLINLHGGGMRVGARYGGQQESIPIASLGKIKVITVDYRMAPEHKFPAASEDVAAVYKALLQQYRAQDIGIYGCSAGGGLTAQSVAWFQTHGLPRPGAVGLFGAGVLEKAGDSDYFASPLMGWGITDPKTADAIGPSDYLSGADPADPMVAAINSPAILRKFPPSLLITGTRDVELSLTVYTHAQLVKAGVEADLHVWEGAAHCSYAQPVVDPAVPETREAWDVTIKFFDTHLGK